MAAPKVRRLGLLHQPSFKAGQSGTRNAGLVGPTQHSTVYAPRHPPRPEECRSEEHTSELQSLMRISYAVFCLKKKKNKNNKTQHDLTTHVEHINTQYEKLVTEQTSIYRPHIEVNI